MIAIINQNYKNEKGEDLYFVKVNGKYISRFYHKRKDGITKCLRIASNSTVEKISRENNAAK